MTPYYMQKTYPTEFARLHAGLDQAAASSSRPARLNQGRRNLNWISFEEAMAHVQELGLQSRKNFWDYCQDRDRLKTVPTHPERVYRNQGWQSWGHFLGTEFVPFQSALAIIQSLKNVNTPAQYRDWCKGGVAKLNKMPTKPWIYCKGSGWLGWDHFFGR